MKWIATVASLLAGLLIAWALYSLTHHPSQSALCEDTNTDLAGILFDDKESNQDALANRAILKQGLCKPD
ncbi:MAG: hypothetical protein AAF991_01885 [Pseudomonadota bacterium]